MTDTGIGHNRPPIADAMAAAFSPIALAADHEALGVDVQAMIARAGAVTGVADEAQKEVAAGVIIALRECAKRVEDTREGVKHPIIDAGRTIEAFFAGLARELPIHKNRIERLIRDHAFKVAEAERAKRLAEAERERKEAEARAEAARLAEEANRPQVAGVLMDSALKSEEFAQVHEAVAAGPIQDLARTRTPVATTGLRKTSGFTVDDPAALTASLGPLGPHLNIDAIMAAIRAYRTSSEKFGPSWPFRDDDQHAQRRVVVPPAPIPGVEFFVAYEGNIRA